MSGIFSDFKHYLAKHLSRHRSYPFLSATMAACALVDTADGEITYLERVRVDQVMETLEELKVFDPHEGVELFNKFINEIKADPGSGRHNTLEVVLNETENHPEKAKLLIRVCIAISEIYGKLPITDHTEIMRLCGELGVDPTECGLDSSADSTRIKNGSQKK